MANEKSFHFQSIFIVVYRNKNVRFPQIEHGMSRRLSTPSSRISNALSSKYWILKNILLCERSRYWGLTASHHIVIAAKTAKTKFLISNYNQSTSFFSVQNYFFANSIKNYRYNHTNIFLNFVESIIKSSKVW